LRYDRGFHLNRKQGTDAYGVITNGNFEGKNILDLPRDTDALESMHKLGAAEIV
jgi:hypothetical protein